MGSKSNAGGVPCVLVHTDRGEAAMTLPDAASVFGVSEAELKLSIASSFNDRQAFFSSHAGICLDGSTLFLDEAVLFDLGQTYCRTKEHKKWLQGFLEQVRAESFRLRYVLNGERKERGLPPVEKEERVMGVSPKQLSPEDDPCSSATVIFKPRVPKAMGGHPSAKREMEAKARAVAQPSAGKADAVTVGADVHAVVSKPSGTGERGNAAASMASVAPSVSVEGSSAVQLFKSEEFGSVRVLQDGDKFLFCGSDVAKALGYSNPPKALGDHCRSITKRYMPHPQSPDKTIEMLFVSEGDLYRLVAHSKLPSAERFESWVFDDVLPSIRKTGGYSLRSMSSDDLIAKFGLPSDYVEALEALLESKKSELALRARVEVLQPKADYCDTVLNSPLLIRHTQLSADLGYSSPTQMLRDLEELKVIKRVNGQWVLRARYCGQGYAHSKKTLADEDGSSVEVILGWTPTGERLVREILFKAGKVSSLSDAFPSSDTGTEGTVCLDGDKERSSFSSDSLPASPSVGD